MKYQMLIQVLDQIRKEATEKYIKKYLPDPSNIEAVNQARSRAYIHLFLKVSFGLLDFQERERFVTDGSQDGGIDGYYISKETKSVWFVQSKFRTNQENFEEKQIALEELLAMEVDRIMHGEILDEQGVEFSGKIKQLQRDVSDLPDISRYAYKIVILANLKNVQPATLKRLFSGYSPEVFDFEKCYKRLIFPVISGTYFNASDLNINIDLSNKNAGSKISYTVKTNVSDCEITVLFVPTIELARIMSRYKNSILRYNPRSYLEHDGKAVHQAIKDSILQISTNEFALFNNGITMLSEETFINEKIGQKNRAQLTVKNPQILNGGQTCFTLSRIYEESSPDKLEKIFFEKEVLLKIITLKETTEEKKKLQLIESISNATNKQTPVINADKFANENVHIKLQEKVFDLFGYLYERKRGEFADGIYNGYIDKKIIIERNLFLRIFYSSNGNVGKGIQKRLFQKNDISEEVIHNDRALHNFFVGFQVFNYLWSLKSSDQRANPAEYAKVYLYVRLYHNVEDLEWFNKIGENVNKVNEFWDGFVSAMKEKHPPKQRFKIDRLTGERYLREKRFSYNFFRIKRDLDEYIEAAKISK